MACPVQSFHWLYFCLLNARCLRLAADCVCVSAHSNLYYRYKFVKTHSNATHEWNANLWCHRWHRWTNDAGDRMNGSYDHALSAYARWLEHRKVRRLLLFLQVKLIRCICDVLSRKLKSKKVNSREIIVRNGMKIDCGYRCQACASAIPSFTSTKYAVGSHNMKNELAWSQICSAPWQR